MEVIVGQARKHLACRDAARRWDALTSAENVEKGAQAIDYAFDDTEEATELCRQLSESVLRAVSEEGNNE